MTNDTRLVVCRRISRQKRPTHEPQYHIDCVPDQDVCATRQLLTRTHIARCQRERQGTPVFLLLIVTYHTLSVIRLFGVFTHAQLDHGGFWDTLSQQLQQGGAQYVERRTFRNKPLSPGDNVILPAMFPPLPIQDNPRVDPFIKPNERDIKAVSEMNDDN
jgi:hypothetical protein